MPNNLVSIFVIGFEIFVICSGLLNYTLDYKMFRPIYGAYAATSGLVLAVVNLIWW